MVSQATKGYFGPFHSHKTKPKLTANPTTNVAMTCGDDHG